MVHEIPHMYTNIGFVVNAFASIVYLKGYESHTLMIIKHTPTSITLNINILNYIQISIFKIFIFNVIPDGLCLIMGL